MVRRCLRACAAPLCALFIVALTACGAAPAASRVESASPTAATTEAATTIAASQASSVDDLAPLSDEFDDARSLTNWKELAAVEGFPNRVQTLDVNTTSLGHLYLVPYTCTWFQDYRGVFLFKEITGDFDVRTRIRATGKETEVPVRHYSLSGLMARAPRDITPETWEPWQENWMFITTGYGDAHPRREGKPQIETKTTKDSDSRLSLIVSRSGWVELRVVRLGSNFLMLYRYEGEDWKLSQRFVRPDLPQTLQVGMNAYTNSQAIPPDQAAFIRTPTTEPGDLIVRSDYVRFQRPRVPEELQPRIDEGTLKQAEWASLAGE